MSIAGVLRSQAGLISRAQALAQGMSSSTVSRKVSSGAWLRVHPRLYLAADHRLTDEVRLRAAALWAGPGAVVSGVAAAWWHGLWSDPAPMVDLTVPVRRQLAPKPGLRLRRRDLDPSDVVEVRSLCVTGVLLTVLEASVALGPRGPALLDRALQRWVGYPALHAAHCRNLGRLGSPARGELLRAASDRAASEAERIMIGLLRGARLTGWRCGYRIGQYQVDFAFPDSRVAVEVDGWAWHSDVDRFRRDRQRQNELVVVGWTVLRFTWHDLAHRPDAVMHDLAHRPDAVITEIRAVLAT